ncbi:MAG TPA: exodeoxyribonuclease V subunit alpha [Acidimicrobiales bacterium]|nr:exodeoxyribonuclease V subunit alpha [Acidimicrobiales bacterium]
MSASLAPLGPERAYGLVPGSLMDMFNRAGVISSGDVHVARVIARLGGGAPEEVLLAVALAARAPRMGHVLVDLGQVHVTAVPDAVPGGSDLDPADLPWPSPGPWVEQVRDSGLGTVGEPGEPGGPAEPDGPRPLRLVGHCLYLARYWQDETVVAGEVLARAAQPRLSSTGSQGWVAGTSLDEALERLFGGQADGAQALAARRAMTSAFSVISGGPGTGKTTTVARFLALVFEEALAGGTGTVPVALAAPTGKAAARMGEAVRKEASRADMPEPVRAALMGLSASTVHRLLGRVPGRQDRFRYGRDHRLPHDVVVVDETSMMSLPLMARLLEAVRPGARLVLVGDHEQLASVEAGAVLADLVGPVARPMAHPVARAEAFPTGSPLAQRITVLEDNHRFAGPLAELASHVRAGRSRDALAMLEECGPPAPAGSPVAGSPVAGSPVPQPLSWVRVPGAPPVEELKAMVVQGALDLVAAGMSGDAEAGLEGLERWRLLCAHRDGPAGASTWNTQVEAWLATEEALVAPGGWYAGRPVVVTENDYSLGLFNGDSGLTVRRPDGGLSVAFRRGADLEMFSPARLARVQTCFAMTAHRAQGSEFDRVCVLLPDAPARVLSRELLYTALTRARSGVVVVASRSSLVTAIERPVARASRLTERTWGASSPPGSSPATVPGNGSDTEPGNDTGA